MLLRQESQPRLIRDIAWKGQLRLCARYRRLARTGKPANIVTTAIARELSGFVWERGGITKAGNGAARRLLIEAAWSYRFPARLSRELLLRQENQPKPIRDIAWKGQVRLCTRYRRLARTGKPANVVTTAIARELSGFVWAIARQVMATAG